MRQSSDIFLPEIYSASLHLKSYFVSATLKQLACIGEAFQKVLMVLLEPSHTTFRRAEDLCIPATEGGNIMGTAILQVP